MHEPPSRAIPPLCWFGGTCATSLEPDCRVRNFQSSGREIALTKDAAVHGSPPLQIVASWHSPVGQFVETDSSDDGSGFTKSSIRDAIPNSEY